ncbi:SapC family protein [Ochrobactrum sp. GPK 3]|uniref:SapC family protein n=1 Tax=Brucella sp. 22210 TaxID=3453892 RepID=UPI00313857B9
MTKLPSRQNPAQVETKIMLIYKDITALSRDTHKELRLDPEFTFDFAANTQWVPLSGVEFYKAAIHYPIVFLKEGDKLMPIALLSLQANHNEFVGANMAWRPNSYVPAFVRRYPFVLADLGAAKHELTVCIDQACPRWNEEKGVRLFQENGENTRFLDEMISFMDDFRLEMQRTAQFVETLTRLELLVERTVNIQSVEGATLALQNIYLVDEAKFATLSNNDLQDLHQKGMLGWIYAHLMSLATLPPLLSHITQASNGQAQNKPQSASKNSPRGRVQELA